MSTTRPIYAKSAVLACLLVLALLQKPLEVDGHELHTMTRTPIDFSNVDEIEPCGFEEPDKETLLIMQEEAIQSSMENARRPFLELLVQIFCAFFPRNSVCNIVIPVYVHNIESNSGEGHLSDDQIREMIQIGNDHLASTGFVLRLMRIKRRVSTDLYASFVRSPEETEMMTQMREGGPETMNVFIKRVHTPTGAFCGVASLARSARSSGARDGILLMPGCALHDKTFAHEIGTCNVIVYVVPAYLRPSLTYIRMGFMGSTGHWLNLLHTFSGGTSVD